MKWFIGCSGFHYKEWKGVFYPEKLAQKNWFAYYCQHFNTIELNVTFYRFPQPAFLKGWYEKSPQGFCFAVKAPRLITHYKQFNETEQLLSDFYLVVKDGLKEKLGAILFQLPGKIAYTEDRLQRIIKSLDTNYTNVVEFRHTSWWDEHVYDQLAKHNIIFCSISHPNLPDNIITNTSTVYYRYHGVPKLYYSEYDKSVIKKMADEIKQSKKIKQAYIYFNNTAGMGAINNARQLIAYTDLVTDAGAV